MAKRHAVSLLSKEVLLQLHQRIVDSNFGNYSEHSNWLKSLGFSISKSSIHRYGMDNKDQICQSVAGHNKTSDEMRMRCLELAHRMVGGNDSEALFEQADVLLRWVRIG